MIKVNLKDFSRRPFGRFITDGKWSGERFRNEFLVPAFSGRAPVVVDLNGVDGEVGSSFLEEAFAGLLRNNLITYAEIKSRMRVVSDKKDYVLEIWDGIERARIKMGVVESRDVE